MYMHAFPITTRTPNEKDPIDVNIFIFMRTTAANAEQDVFTSSQSISQQCVRLWRQLGISVPDVTGPKAAILYSTGEVPC